MLISNQSTCCLVYFQQLEMIQLFRESLHLGPPEGRGSSVLFTRGQQQPNYMHVSFFEIGERKCRGGGCGFYKMALYLPTDGRVAAMVYLGYYPWRNSYLLLPWWIFPCISAKCQCRMVRLERRLCTLILWNWHQKLTFREEKETDERDRKEGERWRKSGKREKQAGWWRMQRADSWLS